MVLYVVSQIRSNNIPKILDCTDENVNKQRIPSDSVLGTRKRLDSFVRNKMSMTAAEPREGCTACIIRCPVIV